MENLIEELVKTPKWNEFSNWYDLRYSGVHGNELCSSPIMSFKYDFPFEFQKGVFEKFIEENGYEIYNEGGDCYNLYKGQLFIVKDNHLLNCETFQELLIYFFNLK